MYLVKLPSSSSACIERWWSEQQHQVPAGVETLDAVRQQPIRGGGAARARETLCVLNGIVDCIDWHGGEHAWGAVKGGAACMCHCCALSDQVYRFVVWAAVKRNMHRNVAIASTPFFL